VTAAARRAGALAAVALLGVLLTGCFGIPIPDIGQGNDRETRPRTEGNVHRATEPVAASDPRITRAYVIQNFSGFAKVLSIAVRITGANPVSAETARNIAGAAFDATDDDLYSVSILFRDDVTGDILDVSAAAAELGEDAHFFDNQITFFGSDR
jgi:hypothetical protein